jgi:hypothetical protein
MITGFNQDVTFKNKVYHVQTEDRGKGNPVIESLIYVGGEILASKRISYEQIIKDGYEEAKVAALLEQQHRRIVVDIKLGKYSPEEPKAFGEGLVSNRSLDEVILEYLTNESESEKLVVDLVDQSPFTAGEPGRVQIRTFTDISRSPLEGAEVRVHIATSDGTTRELFKGKTNKEGHCSAAFSVPLVAGSAVVIVDVTHPKGTFQTKALVSKKQG